jgi:hypothetical protein
MQSTLRDNLAAALVDAQNDCRPFDDRLSHVHSIVDDLPQPQIFANRKDPVRHAYGFVMPMPEGPKPLDPPPLDESLGRLRGWPNAENGPAPAVRTSFAQEMTQATGVPCVGSACVAGMDSTRPTILPLTMPGAKGAVWHVESERRAEGTLGQSASLDPQTDQYGFRFADKQKRWQNGTPMPNFYPARSDDWLVWERALTVAPDLTADREDAMAFRAADFPEPLETREDAMRWSAINMTHERDPSMRPLILPGMPVAQWSSEYKAALQAGLLGSPGHSGAAVRMSRSREPRRRSRSRRSRSQRSRE